MALRLRPDLEASLFDEGGGKQSVILKDPVTEKFFRLSAYEYIFLSQFDGRFSIPEAVRELRASGRFYPEDHVKTILEKASVAGLLLGTMYGTAEWQDKLRERQVAAKKARRFSEVFFLFIPVLNPDRFLERTLWLFRLIYNKWTGMLLIPATVGAIYFFIDGLPRISWQYLYFFNFENLIYLWLTIALVKLIHEFGHAYVAKGYGLHVPQMGVAFLIFFPCLYCNTTDAWTLARREQRFAIAGAGIAAEFVLGVLATYIWYFSKPGMVNSLAFYLVAVSLASTVLFNGNPLIRYDGYYMLSDWLRIPNLMAKSRGYLLYLFMNLGLGVERVKSTARDRREVVIFMIHGIAQFLYRVFLYSAIVLGVYYRFDKAIGVLLALIAVALFIVRPAIKGVGSLYARRSEMKPRLSGIAVIAGIVSCLLLALFLPMSWKSVYPCYLASAEVQKLTVPLLSAVGRVFVQEGSAVNKGAALFDLDATRLGVELRKKEIKREIVKNEIEILSVDEKDRSRVREKILELGKLDHQVKYVRDDYELARNGMTAPFDGVVTKLDHRVQEGFQPGKGVVVGEFKSSEHVLVYALIPEEDRDKVREGQEAEVWFPIGTGLILKSTVETVRPYHERDLKDLPFSSRHGGQLATEARGEQQRNAPIEPVYLCAVRLEDRRRPIPLGITGELSVESTPKSLARSSLERVVRAFNRESFF